MKEVEEDTSPSEFNVVPSRIEEGEEEEEEDYFLEGVKSLGGEEALQYGKDFWKQLEERDDRLARRRREETRKQTNEINLESKRQATETMSHNQQLQSEVMGGIEQNAESLEGIRSEMRTFAEASTEAMRASRNGETVVKLRDSAIKNKQLRKRNTQLENEMEVLANENEKLRRKLVAAVGNTDGADPSADDDTSPGGIDLLNTFNAHADASSVPDSNDVTTAAAAAFTATEDEDYGDGGYGEFTYYSIEDGNNGSSDVLGRSKAAEETSIRRQKVARQDRDVAEYEKQTLPGAPTSFPNVSSKIDTGPAASATTKKDSSKTTIIPASNQKRACLRPPLCPPSTKKASDSGDGTSFSTPARRGGNRGVGSSAVGRSARGTRSTRSATKRAAATVGESPSEGTQPKRARRSPRSASTK